MYQKKLVSVTKSNKRLKNPKKIQFNFTVMKKLYLSADIVDVLV